MSRVLEPSVAHLRTAAATIAQGGLVGLPTETVYGLAADAYNPVAVARIFAAKERPSFNPLIVHVPTRGASLFALQEAGIVARSHVASEVAQRLMHSFWPGPLTLVLRRGSRVPDLVTAGLDTVAVRCPDHPVAQALLSAVSCPLAAPSANRSGRISPTRPQHVVDELGDRVALVLDGGACAVGLESTVAFVSEDGALTVLRPGAVSVEDLRRVLGRPVGTAREADPDAPRSPGMGSRHYAPTSPFYSLSARPSEMTVAARRSLRAALETAEQVGVLCWSSEDARQAADAYQRDVFTVVVCPDGQPSTAARRLFGCLRELEESSATLLLAEPCPPRDAQSGLGWAIQNRLARATTPLPSTSA